MGENIKELLNEEIAAEIQAISSLDSGSEKKSKAIEDLAKLYRLRIEESKNELDAEDKRSRRTLESEAKQIYPETQTSIKNLREMACTFAKKMEMFASMNKKNSSIFMTAKLIGESIQDLLHAME